MFNTIDEFIAAFSHEAEGTQKVMDALTDASLGQPVYEGGRTLGQIAWHLVQTPREMLERTGLSVDGPGHDEPMPEKAVDIAAAYRATAAAVVDKVGSEWNDATLRQTDNMYGEEWTRDFTISALITHQIHHRGQMTVLMRQAGLRVPGLFGPAKEEWAAMGMEPMP